MSNFFSLQDKAPPGFVFLVPNKRQLLTGHIALYVAELDDAFALLPDFFHRVKGLIICPGPSFSHDELTSQLWHLTVPVDFLPFLYQLVECVLDIMKRANQENENNLVLIKDMSYNSKFHSQTQAGYNKAMERLQVMVKDAHDKNERRKEAIVQLNHEISERKKAQEEQLRLESRLHQAQKMEAIGLMAGGVAHDLNNILAGVVGYPDLLLLTLPEDSSLRQPLENIKESGRRAAEIVADLLTIARSSANFSEVGNLNLILYQYLDSLDFRRLKSMHPAIEVELDLDNSLANISCSASHIKKCLMNLIVNGAEAVEGDGFLRINTRVESIEQDWLCGDQQVKKGSYAVIGVEDSGKGIDNDDLEHIFEPFYSRKKMGSSGTGLGLTVVWNTVQDHGGAVRVTSSSSGTLFELFFPITLEPLPMQEKEIPLEYLKGNQETIMVVDDEKLLLDLARKMLSKLNYRVVTMGSGEEAIAYLGGNVVELIVLDMVMDPGINGRQTYEEILRIRSGQRAIIASGFAENEDVKKVLALGASSFLRKPYTTNALGLAVKEALAQKVD